jgi:HK97 gp10 family phage protein
MPDDAFLTLQAKLDSLKRDAVVSAERKALRQVGTVIRDAIVEVCPVQAGEPEGLLKANELKESFRSYVRIASDAGITAGKEDIVTVQPSTQVCRDVALWVERGHAGPTSDSKRTKPHPFIRPTQDSIEQKAIDTYASVMNEEIQKVLNE